MARQLAGLAKLPADAALHLHDPVTELSGPPSLKDVRGAEGTQKPSFTQLIELGNLPHNATEAEVEAAMAKVQLTEEPESMDDAASFRSDISSSSRSSSRKSTMESLKGAPPLPPRVAKLQASESDALHPLTPVNNSTAPHPSPAASIIEPIGPGSQSSSGHGTLSDTKFADTDLLKLHRNLSTRVSPGLILIRRG